MVEDCVDHVLSVPHRVLHSRVPLKVVGSGTKGSSNDAWNTACIVIDLGRFSLAALGSVISRTA